MHQPAMVVQWPSFTKDQLFADHAADRDHIPFLESLCRQKEGWVRSVYRIALSFHRSMRIYLLLTLRFNDNFVLFAAGSLKS